MSEQYSSEEEEQSYTTDGEEIDSSDEYDDDLPPSYDSKPSKSEVKQHILAVAIAILAAITTHAQIHGGYGAWKAELIKDWDALRSSFSRDAVKPRRGGVPRAIPSSGAPHAAPSMNAIPSELRQRALHKALSEEEAPQSSIGHARASSYKRTASISFCPPSLNEMAGISQSNNGLVDLEFILPLYSVRVLHSYYLADAFGVDSSFVYDNVERFGRFDDDVILKEIDAMDDGEVGLEKVRELLASHLGEGLVNEEHACLLQQYLANKQSGKSIRGRTKAYSRPHVSSFYQSPGSVSNAVSISGSPEEKVAPASLTFTGFATKFINLSTQSLNLYWDGGRIPSGPKEGQLYTNLVGMIPSMESIGTASFPGHSFFVTPTYDKEHVLQRWTVTEDDVILYYNPFENMSVEDQRAEVQKLVDSGKMSLKQKFAREAWMVDRSFGRDYLVKTGRHWLSVFPQPLVPVIGGDSNDREMQMRSADFIGQVHTVKTSQLYFTKVPDSLPKLTKDDYHPAAEEQRRLEMKSYQSSQLKDNAIDNNSTLSLSLKVISCAPRVLEVKKFLSPVEIQHLIDLASGAKGDVNMQPSTVLASGLNGSKDKKVRGLSKHDTRSSSGGWIHREQDVIVDGIFRRVADLLNIDERIMRDQRPPHLIGNDGTDSLPTHDRIVEAMQLLRYEAGEEYTPHHDFTYPSIENRYQPKRYATVLLYLTGEGDVIEDGIRRSRSKKSSSSDDGLQGGETTFPRAITTEYHDGVKVQPQSGKAVLFYNVLPDGNMDDLSQHSGGKVVSGVKYVANIWVWDPIIA